MKEKLLFIIALISLSSLSATTCKDKKPSKSPTEKELTELILIQTKYSNNSEGVPALIYAVIKNDVKAIDLLLKNGADPFTIDCKRQSCFYHAVIAGHLDLVKKFISLGHNPINLFDVNKHPESPILTSFCQSIYFGQPKVAMYLLEKGYYYPEALDLATFLMLSHPKAQFPKNRRQEFVLHFISRGLDLNSTEIQGRTHLQHFLLAHPNDTEMADFLRNLGAE